MGCRFLGTVLLVSLLATSAYGQTAGPMAPFRARLVDHAGRPITGPTDLTFRIYDAPTGGKLLAGPYGPIRAVPQEGAFSANYGPIPWGLVEGEGRPAWLEVSVRGGPLRRVALTPFYYDGLDPGGRLGGGKTLMPVSDAAFSADAESGTSRSTTLNVQTVLDNGPSSNRLDMVFLGDGYTEADLGAYASQVEGALAYMLNSEPFKTYRTFFNVYRVDVISNESGIDNDPDPGIYRDTALDMGFWCGGVERIFCIDVADVDVAASEAPARDATFVLANSTKYGGSAYVSERLAMFSGGNGFAGDVATHEAGHAIGRLADEYDYADGARWMFGEPSARNVSSFAADSMAAMGIKWAPWLGDPGYQYSGLVDTYEGAAYYQYGIYRPTEFSKMRVVGPAFNHPSAEGLILQFYQFVRPIDGGTPAMIELEQNAVPFVDPVDPVGHALAIQWYVDGTPIPGATQESFDVGAADFPLGDHVLSVTVTDTTWLVRDEPARATWLTETRWWPVTIGDYRPVVTAPASISELEGTLISFPVGVVDPDGDPILSLTATGTAIAAGGTFTEDPSHASGTFQWTPTLAQSGRYDVTFTALNGRTGRSVTVIDVVDTDKHPELTAPSVVNGSEGQVIAFGVSVVDPDGDPITSLAANGPVFAMGATFDPDPSLTSGQFQWEPGYDQSGDYVTRFVASNVYSDTVITTISVAEVDRTPTLEAVAFIEGGEGSNVTFDVYASDPDDQAISSLTAAGSAIDAGGTFAANGANSFGTFQWTPNFDQAGTYSAIFTASNALAGTTTTTIIVRNVNRPPEIVAPPVPGAEGTLLQWNVTATDPDGEPIESLAASPLPPGAVFETGSLPAPAASGVLRWTPDYTQAGTYPVLLSAESACRAIGVSGALVCDRGTASILLEVANTDRQPLVTAPATAEGDENAPIEIALGASDPDGEPILAWSAEPLPGSALLSESPDHSTATFQWTPSFTESGIYTVMFTAANALAGTAVTTITVRDTDRSPQVVAPSEASVDEGVELMFGVTATDPDLDGIAALEADGLPVGATFTSAPDHTTGQFRWTPEFGQSGSYAVSFRATNTAVGTAVTQILVHDVNRAPTADAGGPYAGVAGQPVAFDGTNSSDPDGGPLAFEWEFGDGGTAAGSGPSHAYSAGGVYLVTLTVRDTGAPPLSASATAVATITDDFEARVFLSSAYRTIRLGSGKPTWCARIEPRDGAFQAGDLVSSSFRATYGDGSIAAMADKAGTIGDFDRNGIEELEVCFSKADLRTLLASLGHGRESVTIGLFGELASGALTHGSVVVEVVSNDEGLRASIAPNPLRRDGMLTFSLSVAGRVRVSLFDLRGRLVATPVDGLDLGAGYHDVSIRATGAPGLASGIYFYRVDAPEGTASGRFVVAR